MLVPFFGEVRSIPHNFTEKSEQTYHVGHLSSFAEVAAVCLVLQGDYVFFLERVRKCFVNVSPCFPYLSWKKKKGCGVALFNMCLLANQHLSHWQTVAFWWSDSQAWSRRFYKRTIKSLPRLVGVRWIFIQSHIMAPMSASSSLLCGERLDEERASHWSMPSRSFLRWWWPPADTSVGNQSVMWNRLGTDMEKNRVHWLGWITHGRSFPGKLGWAGYAPRLGHGCHPPTPATSFPAEGSCLHLHKYVLHSL